MAYQGTSEIHSNRPPMFPKGHIGTRVVANPAGVVVGSRQRHVVGFPPGLLFVEYAAGGDCGNAAKNVCLASWE